ncbi:hypothetical protein [Dielma fastidiosa]|uniref:hypothetical protein n=1 Tax=Dielma fastidiosa TaxID=1034346 RepID=UPI000E517621|nr:hypothetical protein [Dielma fastidiosa]RHN02984.1 hypothetical protein DWZ33_02650 [Dielma fastidiosa]
MATIIDVMLSIKRERTILFYHKDTNQFDNYPISKTEMKNLSDDASIPEYDYNNFRLPSYEEIGHKEIMRLYVKDCVEDKVMRTALFNILRRDDYVDAFLEKLQELALYDDFLTICGDIYNQIFEEWASKNDLHFS